MFHFKIATVKKNLSHAILFLQGETGLSVKMIKILILKKTKKIRNIMKH